MACCVGWLKSQCETGNEEVRSKISIQSDASAWRRSMNHYSSKQLNDEMVIVDSGVHSRSDGSDEDIYTKAANFVAHSLCRPTIQGTAENSGRTKRFGCCSPKAIEAILFRLVNQPVSRVMGNTKPRYDAPIFYIWKAGRYCRRANWERRAAVPSNVLH
jgi:hypothetical protein